MQGWLEAHLVDGEAPPRPKEGRRGHPVAVPPALAVALHVRWLRDAQGLTQAALAERVGVSQQQIAKLKRPGGNPSVGSLAKVAAALGCQVVAHSRSSASSDPGATPALCMAPTIRPTEV